MTHYPTEDAEDILRQLARFNQDIDWLKANGLPSGAITRHTANTFATLHHPQTRLDMVRVGGALYGDTSADFLARFQPDHHAQIARRGGQSFSGGRNRGL